MARVLMVLDGGFRFSEIGMKGIRDFTYIALLEALSAAGHTVISAHRQLDTTAKHQLFNFETSVNLLDFDVLWLIGYEGRNLMSGGGTSAAGIGDAEVRAIARFMAAGGGLFATGDHDGIGNVMCGRIPRVRAMRSWYGVDDSASPMPAAFPRNFPTLTADRADSTLQNPAGNYGGDTTFVWFENQSDSVPQTILPTTTPAHPILRHDGADIVVYPDHMHEGNTLGEVMGYDYTQSLTFDGESFTEFPLVAGQRELPSVIAIGQSLAHSTRTAENNTAVDSAIAGVKPINTLSAYDGRAVGVGRIVTGSTFHHYVDINLTGDSDITTVERKARTGPDAEKGHGFNDAPTTFASIKTVFGNIADWLARPRPRIQLILEHSTFSQAEATANPNFAGAILVTVDGLKPDQFPSGGITSLTPAAFNAAWAPTITPLEPSGINIIPTGVGSDDPGLSDRLQRITFTYRVQLTAAAAFSFAEDFNHVQVNAALTSPAVSDTLTDSAQLTLVKSANPFMLDLAGGNTTPWLSSDVKVFSVVAGAPGSGLVNEASRDEALTFLRGRLSTLTDAQFDALSGVQADSALSPFERTTVSNRKVYNFAVARVRLPANGASAADVRVFFRIFTSQTTAALTYHEATPGVPVGGYKKTASVTPVALPGTNGAVTEWLSFPMFMAPRAAVPAGQTDADNVKDISPGVPRFFGCLIDNNLPETYLPSTPAGGPATSLPTLMMGEHQCIVAQIEFPSTPIPNGANPFTSDKLSQRNIALSPIANPGLDASRMALHTFEIEATPHAIGDDTPPDELLLEWHSDVPEGAEVRLHIPRWNARDVVSLAERFYPRAEIRALDSNTVALPGGGMRYVPIPMSQQRQTGVIAVHFPLGIKRGQRFDLSVRQLTTRGRQVDLPQPKTTVISLDVAARFLDDHVRLKADKSAGRGVFELGENRVLITDLRLLDAEGDHAVIIEHPDPATVEAAIRKAERWRETIGAFQLGIPVSVKADMLAHQLRLLSVLRWRAEFLRPGSRWYETFIRYVELNAEKVRALGGDPFSVSATPDGIVPLPGKSEHRAGCLDGLLLAIRRLAQG